MKVYDYLSCDSPYQKGDHVEGLIYEILDSFGAFVAVDNQYSALIPHNEMTRELHIGDVVKARIKEVTEEGKLTLSLQEKTKVQMGKDAELIYERLQKKAVSCHSTIKPLRRLSSVNSKSAKPPSNEPSAGC